MPSTDRGVRMLAEREDWARFSGLCRQRAGRGGGLEYHVNLLPMAAQVAYRGAVIPTPSAGEAIQASPEPVPGILFELGVLKPKGTLSELTKQAIELLSTPDHPPLFIDEADKLVDRVMIENIREIADKSKVAIILIGEEALPDKLARVERVYGRVISWVPAQPVDLEDCRKLASRALGNIQIDDDVLESIRRASEGRGAGAGRGLQSRDLASRRQAPRLFRRSRQPRPGGEVSGRHGQGARQDPRRADGRNPRVSDPRRDRTRPVPLGTGQALRRD